MQSTDPGQRYACVPRHQSSRLLGSHSGSYFCHRSKFVCIGSIELIASQLASSKMQLVLQALPFVLKTESKRQLKVDLEAKLEELCRSQNLLKHEGVLVTL